MTTRLVVFDGRDLTAVSVASLAKRALSRIQPGRVSKGRSATRYSAPRL